MTTHKSWPKLERLSSLKYSEGSDSANEYMPTAEEIAELVKFQKAKQFHNISKFEQLHNGPNNLLINSLQDTELNDLIMSVNSYIHLCMHKIHKKDNAFSVIIENFKFDPNESDIKTFKKSSKSSATTVKVIEENKNLQYLKASNRPFLEPDLASIKDDEKNPIILEQIVSLDFLRNGLKCGPLQVQKDKDILNAMLEQNTKNTLPNLTNPNGQKQDKDSDENASKNENGTTSPSTSRLSMDKPQSSVQKPTSSVQKPQSSAYTQNSTIIRALNANKDNKQLVTFRYMLVFDLNKNNFELTLVNEKEYSYSVMMHDKPSNWSQNDYEQLTLEVKSNSQEPMEQIHANILKKKEKYKGFKNYLSQEVKPRHLNSKAVLDRLLKHFSTVLKKDWPDVSLNSNEIKKEMYLKQMYQAKKNAYQYQQNTPPRIQILEESKSIDIKDNQLRIGFKWQGIKFKDLDVLLLINIGIKFNDEKIQTKLNESMLEILNKFITKNANGYYHNIEKSLRVDDLSKINTWLSKHLKFTFDQYHLSPNLVHYWSINVRVLKLNFFKFLIFLNCCNPNITQLPANAQIINTGLLSNVNDLLNGVYFEKINSSTKQATPKTTVFNIFNNKKSPNYNFMAIMNNNCSLYMLLKILQIFFFNTINSIEPINRVDDENQTEEDLIMDILLCEISLTNEPHCWSIDNIFERIWSSLIKIRFSTLRSFLMDPFKINGNVMPGSLLKYIGYFGIEPRSFVVVKKRITDIRREQASKVLDTGNKNIERKSPNVLLTALENMMKVVFTSILTEEVNIYLLNYDNNNLEEKTATTNENFNQLIHQNKPGTSMRSDELTEQTFTGMATKGSDGQKSSFDKKEKKNKLKIEKTIKESK
jgi:hypothetical protein